MDLIDVERVTRMIERDGQRVTSRLLTEGEWAYCAGKASAAEHVAARLAADVMGVPTILLARTDAEAADLVTSDVDETDKPFLTGERTVEGFYRTKKGFEQAVSRGLAYAEVADMVWCETGTPDLKFAKDFADAIHAKFPGKLLAYNCSPSFNWKKNLDDATIAKFQRELGAMGYKFQFITLAGFHSLNYSMFELAHGYARNNMSAFVELQEKEFAAADQQLSDYKTHRPPISVLRLHDETTGPFVA